MRGALTNEIHTADIMEPARCSALNMFLRVPISIIQLETCSCERDNIMWAPFKISRGNKRK